MTDEPSCCMCGKVVNLDDMHLERWVDRKPIYTCITCWMEQKHDMFWEVRKE